MLKEQEVVRPVRSRFKWRRPIEGLLLLAVSHETLIFPPLCTSPTGPKATGLRHMNDKLRNPEPKASLPFCHSEENEYPIFLRVLNSYTQQR